MGGFDIRFFDGNAYGLGDQGFHRFFQQVFAADELLNDSSRCFAFTESGDVYARRDFLVRSLEMLLHSIFFNFDVKNGLTIFYIIASNFQRVLRNISLAGK